MPRLSKAVKEKIASIKIEAPAKRTRKRKEPTEETPPDKHTTKWLDDRNQEFVFLLNGFVWFLTITPSGEFYNCSMKYDDWIKQDGTSTARERSVERVPTDGVVRRKRQSVKQTDKGRETSDSKVGKQQSVSRTKRTGVVAKPRKEKPTGRVK